MKKVSLKIVTSKNIYIYIYILINFFIKQNFRKSLACPCYTIDKNSFLLNMYLKNISLRYKETLKIHST